VQHQFAERAHDEEDDDSPENVGDNETGSSLGDGAARAEEQADADRSSERNELDVPVFEAALEVSRLLLLFGVECELVIPLHVGFLSVLVSDEPPSARSARGDLVEAGSSRGHYGGKIVEDLLDRRLPRASAASGQRHPSIRTVWAQGLMAAWSRTCVDAHNFLPWLCENNLQNISKPYANARRPLIFLIFRRLCLTHRCDRCTLMFTTVDR
jgi:hypothetical protein